ncbi:MAG: Ig-like domain-containing domain [Raineya sp.]|nr:Ig-like domain-containing domain [Raineya sp.]
MRKILIFRVLLGIISVSFVILIVSCANPKGITGGAKDTLAPKVLKMLPSNKTTNYTGKVVILEFNEWVKVNNFQKELIITPSILGNYKVLESKKSIVIEFEKPFNPNTTYTFNFGKGIGDITENNIIKDLSLVFSTGDKLDSLQISGNAVYPFENTPASECTVWLAPFDDTLKVDKHKPYYTTQTDKNGDFKLQNLRAGKYAVYVFKDNNNNNILNSEQEPVGFLATEVEVSNKNIDSLKFLLSISDKKPSKLLRIRPSNNQADRAFIDFNKGISNIKIESEPKIAYQVSGNGKEVTLFNTSKVYDSLSLKIVAKDSLDNITEIEKKVLFQKEIKSGKPKKEQLKTQVFNKSDGEGVTNTFALDIVFSKPITNEDIKKIRFQKDKDSTKLIELEANEYRWDEYKTKFSIEKTIKFKEELKLIIDSMAFESVEKDYSSKLIQKYPIKKAITFGTIKLDLETKEKNFIIELLDDKQKVVRQLKSPLKSKNIIWDYLPANTYTIRLIIDTNNNGKWDAGDFEKRLQPEKVIYYSKQIPLRENWEITEKFIVE